MTLFEAFKEVMKDLVGFLFAGIFSGLLICSVWGFLALAYYYPMIGVPLVLILVVGGLTLNKWISNI